MFVGLRHFGQSCETVGANGERKEENRKESRKKEKRSGAHMVREGRRELNS